MSNLGIEGFIILSCAILKLAYDFSSSFPLWYLLPKTVFREPDVRKADLQEITRFLYNIACSYVIEGREKYVFIPSPPQLQFRPIAVSVFQKRLHIYKIWRWVLKRWIHIT